MSELVKGKYFRVSYIYKVIGYNRKTSELETKASDIKEGLAIEIKDRSYKDKDIHYVVAFVKPDNEGYVDLQEIDFRTISMIDEKMSSEDLWEMMQEYKNCVTFAKDAVLQALKE